jgi:hypothetical protein
MKNIFYFLLAAVVVASSAHAINYETVPAAKVYQVQIVKSNLDDTYSGGSFYGLDKNNKVRVSFGSSNSLGVIAMYFYSVYDVAGNLLRSSEQFELNVDDYSNMSRALRSANEGCMVFFKINQNNYKIMGATSDCTKKP